MRFDLARGSHQAKRITPIWTQSNAKQCEAIFVSRRLRHLLKKGQFIQKQSK